MAARRCGAKWRRRFEPSELSDDGWFRFMMSAFDGSAAGLPGTPEALGGAVWIDLQEPTEVEIGEVARATGLRVPDQAEVSEIEASSRLVRRGDVLYLSMPLITIADGPRVVSAGFVLSPRRLMTVRFAPSRVFDSYKEWLSRNEAPCDSGAHVLTGLLNAIVDRQADAMEKIHADLDNISHRVFALAGKSRAGRKAEDRLLRATLAELGVIGDLISHIRESRLGAARLLPFIESNTADWLPADLPPRLKTLHDDIVSVSDFDNHMSEKMQFLLDATLGFINIAQNDVMKVMTVASVVGIPPVLVAGVYGMNFKNIHEYDWAWGYQFGWAMILLTTLIPLAVFRWRKWI